MPQLLITHPDIESSYPVSGNRRSKHHPAIYLQLSRLIPWTRQSKAPYVKKLFDNVRQFAPRTHILNREKRVGGIEGLVTGNSDLNDVRCSIAAQKPPSFVAK